MKTFKHSGAYGDLIYSLSVVKALGGGEFHLHLDQINWIGLHYYGAAPDPVHQGRLTESDYKFLKPLLMAQEYIKDFKILDRNSCVTHNLDSFRVRFVGHPTNYIYLYWEDFIKGRAPITMEEFGLASFLTVPEPKKVEGRPIAINRTLRWLPPNLSTMWNEWREQGIDQQCFFLGTEQEHLKFQTEIGWYIPHQKVNNALELAQYIQGSDYLIANQSSCLSIAVGLGKKFYCEYRRDLPFNRNECNFEFKPEANYF